MPNLMLQINRDNLKAVASHRFTQTMPTENLKKTYNRSIKQIECNTFDELGLYFNSPVVAEEVREAFLAVNIGDTKMQSLMLDLDEQQLVQEDRCNIKLLYELNTSADTIACVAGSHLIRGESAILLNECGDIYMANEDSASSTCLEENAHLLKVANGIQPKFASFSNWKSVRFGAQPRQLIYADHSQVVSLDSRIKSLNNNLNRALYTLDMNDIQRGELIHRTELAQFDCFTHLVCGSTKMRIVDERFARHAVLSWTHQLTPPAIFFKSFYLPTTRSHVILASDSMEVFAHQFSVKHGTYLSHNFARKLDAAKDLIGYLPDSYDRRLSNHLEYRLSRPMLGFDVIQFQNSFAMFQVSKNILNLDLLFTIRIINQTNLKMHQNMDIFYECFDVFENEESMNQCGDLIRKPHYYTKWLGMNTCFILNSLFDNFNHQLLNI